MAREGKHTCLQSSSLLQHLGLVGATGPHSGPRGESHSPLVLSGERAGRQAHIVQRFELACVRIRAHLRSSWGASHVEASLAFQQHARL